LAKKKGKRTREPVEDYENSFEPELYEEEPRVKYKTTLAYLIDQDEVNRLIEASSPTQLDFAPVVVDINHPTYTKEDAIALINGYNFEPRKIKKKK